MALDILAGKAVGFLGTTGTPAAISLTASWTVGSGGATYTPVTGDTVYVAYNIGGGAADVDVTMTTSGYTEITEVYPAGGTTNANLAVFRKKMGGTPDTTVTPGSTTNNGYAGTVVIYVVSGIDSTPEDVTPTTASGTATAKANPPSISPATTGAVVLVFGGGSATTGAVYTQSGSELSNFVSVLSGDTVDSMIGGGTFAWTSGAFDPVIWAGGTAGANDSWSAACIAVRPIIVSTSKFFAQIF